MAVTVLPIQLVNKIAAGEVIERPASIVKELVENALDAGAGRIDVAVRDGGKELIMVTDDGCGMDAADLSLAFAPHATSKISVADDLFNISTMGFRGEALSSVAAISHTQIRSQQPGQAGGNVVDSSQEPLTPPKPCAGSVGTTVTVRDLFYNVPARRKFMRKANTEFAHVSEQITRLALGHPHVAFTLAHNERTTRNLPAVDLTLDRAGGIFGNDLAHALLSIAPGKSNAEKISISGLIGPPSAARASTKWQYFFLNGRFIRDRLLGHALKEAYRGIIDPNRYPTAFIFIEIDPQQVDINVHPTKIEVRFQNSQAVHSTLLAALRATLNKADLTPVAETSVDAGLTGDSASRHSQSMRDAMADFFKSAPTQPHLDFPRRSHSGSFSGDYRPAPQWTPPAAAVVEAHAASTIQIHDSYLVTAVEDGLIIVDQHALHERVIYNEICHRLTQGPLVGQRLLIPETLKVTAAEADALEQHSQMLDRLGIELSQFGPQTLAVQRFPSLLVERNLGPGLFIRQLIDKLLEDENADSERLLQEVIQMMACKAAVKAGQPMKNDEINALLEKRYDVEKSSACPHGRPTTLKLSLKDLEKQFKR